MIEQWRPRVVFVDLAAGVLVATGGPVGLPSDWPGRRPPFVAFGSHVDTEALARPRAPAATRSCPGASSPATFPN